MVKISNFELQYNVYAGIFQLFIIQVKESYSSFKNELNNSRKRKISLKIF